VNARPDTARRALVAGSRPAASDRLDLLLGQFEIRRRLADLGLLFSLLAWDRASAQVFSGGGVFYHADADSRLQSRTRGSEMFKRGLLIAALGLAVSAGSGVAARDVVALKGVVVGSQKGVVLVATPSGLVKAVRGRSTTGTRVSVTGGRITPLGRATRAVIRGVLVRRSGNLTFLSAAQHILVVRSLRHVASVSDANPAQPQPGAVVQTTVGIDDQGELDQESEQQVGQAGQAQIQAVVSAVGAGTVTITVNGQPLTIPLPAGLTLPASIVGLQVTLNLSFGNGQATAEQDQGDGEGGDDSSGSSTSDSGTFGAGAGAAGGAGVRLGRGFGGGDD
jgi:hypothetical protein